MCVWLLCRDKKKKLLLRYKRTPGQELFKLPVRHEMSKKKFVQSECRRTQYRAGMLADHYKNCESSDIAKNLAQQLYSRGKLDDYKPYSTDLLATDL